METHERQLATSGIPESFFRDIRCILADARQKAYAAVNSVMVEAYWKIGRRIVEEEQGGKDRAEYGSFLIRELSRNLGNEFGKGFSVANLKNFRQFYLTFPNIGKGYALRSELTWTHYRLIMRVENEKARQWYIAEPANQRWSSRRLERNINSFYYERLLKDGQAEVIAERQNYLLFDRMVAFHVQRGMTVPLPATEFYQGLVQRFPECDSMYFLPEQAAEYDKRRLTVKEMLQLEIWVKDQSSAIQWLKQQLTKKPQTFQEIHPQFIKEISGWNKYEKPLELSDLLAQNFLRYDGKSEVPSQIHSYLSTNFRELRNLPKDNPILCIKAKDRWYVPDPNKVGDLENLSERALLREFEEYRESKQRRFKVFRLEAVRASFKKAWQERDYPSIITVAGKIPENVLREDFKLLMWSDQALTRTVEGA
jgi:hypothetical protein